jgi:hypothetical protein
LPEIPALFNSSLSSAVIPSASTNLGNIVSNFALVSGLVFSLFVNPDKIS